MSFAEFADTPLHVIEKLLERLPARQAELTLLFADAGAVPWMEAKGRGKFLDTLRERITPERTEPTPTPALLRMAGIGVELRKPKKRQEHQARQTEL